MSEARKNSVSQLAELYNVVIGIALSLAIYNTIDTAAPLIPIHLDYVTNLATVLVLIIPFYHGAIRHLFASHVDDKNGVGNGSAIVARQHMGIFGVACFYRRSGTIRGA